MTKTVTRFQPLGRGTSTRTGASLLDLAREVDVSVESICGGTGKCGKCRVLVATGEKHLTPINESERAALTAEEVGMGVRLACQATIVAEGDIVVDIPELSRRGHHRLLASGIEPEVQLAPAVGK
ncbi:MAG: 2Fe-2S iron-sulfur cluster-binding protein, partial [Thermoplasmata archaeon]